ncbi:MAG TPA: phosphoribosyl-ATP diphosphatase [Candidatus Saccharimonadales bacterium]|nr:phosphoribosyl-ATP diphosphatase [Candidatus Saccharimonadales bacterium]
MTIDDLYNKIEDRKKNMPENSYVTALFRDGLDRIIQKVGEESTEVVIAAKNESKRRVISEVADLWFHTLVLLAKLNIKPSEVMKELESRKR